MSNTPQKQDRRALSIKEAAQTCGLSRATLYRLGGTLKRVFVIGAAIFDGGGHEG
jgi:DNA-binding IclR family transcriptional regulator